MPYYGNDSWEITAINFAWWDLNLETIHCLYAIREQTLYDSMQVSYAN